MLSGMIFGPIRQGTLVDGPAQHPSVVTGAPWYTVVELIRGLLSSAQDPPNNGERRVRAPEAWDVPRSGAIISSRTILSEIIIVRQETQELIEHHFRETNLPQKDFSKDSRNFFSILVDHRDNPSKLKWLWLVELGDYNGRTIGDHGSPSKRSRESSNWSLRKRRNIRTKGWPGVTR